jgi:hypothetical protein
MVYPSKPAHKKQSHYVKVYLTETEYNVMRAVADKLEIPMSEWARKELIELATRLQSQWATENHTTP